MSLEKIYHQQRVLEENLRRQESIEKEAYKKASLQSFRITSSASNINPRLVNKLSTAVLDASVLGGKITITDFPSDIYVFDEPESIIASFFREEVNTPVSLTLFLDKGYLMVAVKSEYKEYVRAKELIGCIEGEKKALMYELGTLEEKACRIKFWAQYDIPYSFCVGIKPVKSGYSPTSSGNGSNVSTVYHIILNENISTGRLKREKNHFLCSQPTWKEYSKVYVHKTNMPEVTCSSCLKMIERFKKD